MNDFDDLDDLFGQLRSDATEAELAAESSHVDAMARHHRRQKGHIMFTSRRARVATFVAAGVLGFGGIAAAGAADPFDLTAMDDTPTTSEPTPTTSEPTPTTSEVTTTSSEVTTTTSEVENEQDDAPVIQRFIEEIPEADDIEVVGDPDPDTEFDESRCVGDTHGDTVSAAARDEEGLDDVEQRVVAQSSCGKDAKDAKDAKDLDDDGDDLEDQDEVEADDDSDDGDDEDDDEKDERPEKSERPGKSESAGKQGKGSKKHSDD